jgi:hypothetical protein
MQELQRAGGLYNMYLVFCVRPLALLGSGQVWIALLLACV